MHNNNNNAVEGDSSITFTHESYGPIREVGKNNGKLQFESLDGRLTMEINENIFNDAGDKKTHVHAFLDNKEVEYNEVLTSQVVLGTNQPELFTIAQDKCRSWFAYTDREGCFFVGDLKLENVLFRDPVEDDDYELYVKVIDFGIAGVCQPGK